MWMGFPVVCGPMGLPPETVSLYHNDGRGHFTDVTERAGLGAAKAAGLTVLTGDFENNGWPDVFVAADSTPSLFFRNMHDGTFKEGGVLVGLAYNEDGHEQSGMGASAADYDHDGWLDIVKTNFSGDIPNLYRNLGKVGFTEVTAQAGLAVHTQLVGWGCAFLDFDNDGWKDIFIANGHTYPDIDRRGIGQSFKQPRLLYWNRRDGQFYDASEDAGPGITARHSSRGVAVGDLDNDGDVELAVVNMYEHPSLLKNYGDHGNSLLVRLLTPPAATPSAPASPSPLLLELKSTRCAAAAITSPRATSASTSASAPKPGATSPCAGLTALPTLTAASPPATGSPSNRGAASLAPSNSHAASGSEP